MGHSKVDIPEAQKQDFWELFVHPHVPLGYKIGMVLFLLLYLVSPIDIIPDFRIPFGFFTLKQLFKLVIFERTPLS